MEIPMIVYPVAILICLAIAFWFSTFEVEEGTDKIIMRFGAFNRVVMVYQGKHLTPNWDVVTDDTPGPRQPPYFMDAFLPEGRKWKWPLVEKVYLYHFKWTVLQPDEEEESRRYWKREEWLDFDDLRVTRYVLTLEGLETSEGIAMKLRLLLTLQITNSRKAHFDVHHWLQTVQQQLYPIVRSYVGEQTFATLIAREEGCTDDLDTILSTRPNPNKPETVRDQILKYGVLVESVGIQDVIPPPEYAEAATRKYIAERKGEEIRTIAQADADARKIRGEGDAAALRALGKEVAEQGPLGLTLEQLRTQREMGHDAENLFLTTGGGQGQPPQGPQPVIQVPMTPHKKKPESKEENPPEKSENPRDYSEEP